MGHEDVVEGRRAARSLCFGGDQPRRAVLDGVRRGLIDGAPAAALVHDIWPLLVMGAVLIPFGLWAFGRAERYAKRTGKLKRVG